jgi:hypothetical protein
MSIYITTQEECDIMFPSLRDTLEISKDELIAESASNLNSGENNPMWKGGVTYDMKAYKKKRSQTPEHKAWKKEYNKAYQQTPEYSAYKKEYNKTYMKKYNKAYYARKKIEKDTGQSLSDLV